MRLHRFVAVCSVAAAGALFAPSAQADGYLTAFGGIVFGGDLSSDVNDALDLGTHHEAYGAALGAFGSPLGVELDFMYSPEFFGSNRSVVPKNNLVTLMANIVVSGHIGDHSRLYASVGSGLMKSSVEDAGGFFDVGRNDFGVNAGAGVLAAIGDNLALRGDVRYFRNLADDEIDEDIDINLGSFDFWRATGGLSLRF